MPPGKTATPGVQDLVSGDSKLHSTNETCATKLTEEDLAFAKEFLGEDADTRKQQVDSLRKFVQANSYLNARTDDENLLRFLRGCKFNQQRAREKIKHFYELRATSPEWYDLRDPEDPAILKLLKMGVFIPLLKRDSSTGHTVIIVRAAIHNPREIQLNDILKVSKMVMEVLTRMSSVMYIYGLKAIIDLEGVSLGHALQLNPATIKKLVHTWQDCYPVRTRSINFVNAPLHINMFLNIFRKFMTEKMRSRIHTHRSIKPLVSLMNPEVLPEEYGGTGPKISHVIDFWCNEVLKNREWFEEDNKYKADMEMKPEENDD